jgi:malate synthase
MKFAQTGGLSVAQPLHAFVEREALLGTGISATAFWSGLADLVRDFGQRNRQLLAASRRPGPWRNWTPALLCARANYPGF